MKFNEVIHGGGVRFGSDVVVLPCLLRGEARSARKARAKKCGSAEPFAPFGHKTPLRHKRSSASFLLKRMPIVSEFWLFRFVAIMQQKCLNPEILHIPECTAFTHCLQPQSSLGCLFYSLNSCFLTGSALRIPSTRGLPGLLRILKHTNLQLAGGEAASSFR